MKVARYDHRRRVHGSVRGPFPHIVRVFLPADDHFFMIDALRGPREDRTGLVPFDPTELRTGQIGRLDCGFSIIEGKRS